jgi:hypothetical protein
MNTTLLVAAVPAPSLLATQYCLPLRLGVRKPCTGRVAPSADDLTRATSANVRASTSSTSLASVRLTARYPSLVACRSVGPFRLLMAPDLGIPVATSMAIRVSPSVANSVWATAAAPSPVSPPGALSPASAGALSRAASRGLLDVVSSSQAGPQASSSNPANSRDVVKLRNMS